MFNHFDHKQRHSLKHGSPNLRYAYHTVAEWVNQAHPSIDAPRGRSNNDRWWLGIFLLFLVDIHNFIILESDDLFCRQFASITHYLLELSVTVMGLDIV